MVVLIVFSLLISLAVFVSAIQMEKEIPGYGTISGNFIEPSVYLSGGGWKLIHGLPSPDWLSGRLEPENIKAIYGLHPITKEYVRFYPENPELNNLDISMDYFVGNTAFWVYIEGNGITGEAEYFTLESPPIENRQLFAGWNLLGLTYDLVESPQNPLYPEEPTLMDIKGNCIIEKAYIWHGQWYDLSDDGFDVVELESTLENEGLLIKVEDDCNLGYSTDTSGPPGLPGNGGNSGEISSYIIEENIEDVQFIGSSKEEMDCSLDRGGTCTFYRGAYNYQGEIEVLVEHNSGISVNEFIQHAEAEYDNLQEGDFVGNDYYIYQLGDDLLIFWYSNGDIVFITREPYDSSQENDYIEDMLVVYLNKYQSNLNWN